MSGLGSGDSGEFTFLDCLAVLSFFIGVANYDENLSQADKQDLLEELSRKSDYLLQDIHTHLAAQDARIDAILKILEERE